VFPELAHKIRQKPGKPLYFGKLEEKFVFALPGNPFCFLLLSSICEAVFARLFGRKEFDEEQDFAISESFAKKKNKDQTQFLKAFYTKGKVLILNAQESYKMDSVAQANCLGGVSDGATEINIEKKSKYGKSENQRQNLD
jgi:molybdopterin molybdotransferase